MGRAHVLRASAWSPRWVAALAAAVLVAVVVGRFMAFAVPDRPVPAAASSPVERLAALDAATARDPGDAAGWQALAVEAARLAALDADPALYARAATALERAEALAPDAPETLVTRGSLELSLHRFAAAERTGRRAVASAPARADAWAVLVDARIELGRYAEAEAALERMLAIDPGLPALARVSYLRELAGDVTGAVTAMQQAEVAGAGLPSERAAVAVLLGDLHRQRGAYEDAAAAYDRALAVRPDHVQALLGQARVAAALRGPAAIQATAAALTARAPRLDAVALLAEVAAAVGDGTALDEALALARTTAALQRDAGQVVDLEVARLEADLGDPRTAVDLARDAHAARPSSIHAADTLAWALHRAGRSDDARGYVDAALRTGTADPRIRLHAALVLAATGDRAAAARHLATVAASDPTVSLALLDEAGALARDLGVPVPDAWRTS